MSEENDGGGDMANTTNVLNATTIAAIKEAEAMENDPNVKTFTSVDELMEDLLK